LGLLARVADLLARRQGPIIAILGGGPGHEAARVRGGNLVWLGLVDDVTYAGVIANCLAGIVALVPGIGNSVVPSKLASYLAAACPVIVAADPRSEAVRVVEQAGCGFAVPTGRPDLLADTLCRLAAHPAERARLGARGKAYATAHWDKEHIVGLFGTALQILTAGSSR
jgi:colanic acid biosynthesis glycosyl transferase WcaI